MSAELFEKKHDFLVCIDSDGCVFDNMELKHKECFCPATVNVWNLQSVSRYAREAADFVNLYSTTRGVNRYPGIIRTLKLLADRKEAKERGFVCPDLSSLERWIETTPALSISALEKACEENGHSDPILEQTLAWSKEVDRNVAHIVRGAAHFPHVEEALKAFGEYADIVIVSATPKEAIVREWEEHDLLKYVSYVCGQEDGSKAACIKNAGGGRYEKDHILMIGDAPGDFRAAEDNGVLFYPIIPNQETGSWLKAVLQTAGQLKAETYKGKAMDEAMAAFNKALLTEPEWNKTGETRLA